MSEFKKARQEKNDNRVFLDVFFALLGDFGKLKLLNTPKFERF
jgi:hypothetical protein